MWSFQLTQEPNFLTNAMKDSICRDSESRTFEEGIMSLSWERGDSTNGRHLEKNNPHNLLSEHFTQSSAVTINLSLKISPTSLHQSPVYTTWHISHNSTIPIIDCAVVFQAIHPAMEGFNPSVCPTTWWILDYDKRVSNYSSGSLYSQECPQSLLQAVHVCSSINSLHKNDRLPLGFNIVCRKRQSNHLYCCEWNLRLTNAKRCITSDLRVNLLRKHSKQKLQLCFKSDRPRWGNGGKMAQSQVSGSWAPDDRWTGEHL